MAQELWDGGSTSVPYVYVLCQMQETEWVICDTDQKVSMSRVLCTRSIYICLDECSVF